MQKYLVLIFFVSVAIFFYQKTALPEVAPYESPFVFEVAGEQISAVGGPDTPPDYTGDEMRIVHTVAEGETFATILEQYGYSYEDTLSILEIAADIHDFTSVKLGSDIIFVKRGELIHRFEYDIDSETTAVVEQDGETFGVYEQQIAYDVSVKEISATVDESLFLAAANVGLEEAAIIRMAEVLAWSIDFNTAVRPGDSFSIVYESRSRDGKPAQPGKIFAVKYVNQGVEYTGFRFPDADGKLRYYDANGNSLVRQFLKAPLRFSRITSGFTGRRFHPVLGKNTSHKAIDYAAPQGTPIVSVGDGTVTFAGWKTGYGNFIKIKHNSTYSTHYAHLSAFGKGIKAGARVTQGQTIGFVGSTGWSTGPHLHYEIAKNGSLVNPLTLELPAGDPIVDDERAAFELVRDEYIERL